MTNWEITLHPSYAQLERKVPRGIEIIRVYDLSPSQERYMSFMWDEYERMEIPLSISLEELSLAGDLARKEREK